MKTKFNLLSEKTLFKPVDAAPLGLFRVFFGIILLLQSYLIYTPTFILENYIKPIYHFPFSLYEFLHFPQANSNVTWVAFDIMGLAALGITVGLFFRSSCLIFFLSFGYVVLADKTLFYDYHYLILWTTFLLMFTNADRWPALNSLRIKKITCQTVPYWQILVLRFQFVVAYFFGGVSKINADWLFHAEPMYSRLLVNTNLFGFDLHNLAVAFLFSYAGLFINLFAPFMWMNKRTRTLGFALTFLFLAMVHFLCRFYDVKIFPALMLTPLILFMKPQSLRRSLEPLSKTIFKKLLPPSNIAIKEEAPVYSHMYKKTIGYLLVVYFIFQLLFPLRYLLYPGDARWTFEGTRAGWRYKVSAKDTKIRITITDSKTGKKFDVPYQRFLTPQQQLWMTNAPDVLVGFLHELRDGFIEIGVNDPVINLEFYASLNGRPYQLYVDPTLDFAKVEYPAFSHAPWIIPLKK